jgi:hypothetical protein
MQVSARQDILFSSALDRCLFRLSCGYASYDLSCMFMPHDLSADGWLDVSFGFGRIFGA